MWECDYDQRTALHLAAAEGHYEIMEYYLIHQIWTNLMEGSDHKSGIIHYQITDHLPIFFLFRKILFFL